MYSTSVVSAVSWLHSKLPRSGLREKVLKSTCDAPVGERDSGGCRGSQSGADAGNNLMRNICTAQGFQLFAGSPEHRWVAAFQANNRRSSLRVRDQQRIDFVLE